MGAKTALLAFTDGDLRPALRGAVRADRGPVVDLVRTLHPGYEVTAIGDGSLGEDAYPPEDTSYAAVLAGAELFCDRRPIRDRPSQLPDRRRIIMHSGSDWLCFAVWEHGHLIRSLFGFILEGRTGPDDVDPFDVHLHGFRVVDPTGREQAERESSMKRLPQRMKPPRRLELTPDGQWREIDDRER